MMELDSCQSLLEKQWGGGGGGGGGGIKLESQVSHNESISWPCQFRIEADV